MPGAAIIYFSGTGNTWAVARHYAQSLAALGHETELLPLERLFSEGLQERLAAYDLLGFGYPVHAWGLPRLVAGVLTRLPVSEGQETFLFATAARGAGRALEAGQALLAARGYHVAHQAHYYAGPRLLSQNQVGPDPAQDARRERWLRRDVLEAAIAIASARERRPAPLSRERDWALRAAWQVYRLGCSQIRRNLRADERCTRCGLCVRACPSGNLSLVEQERPEGAIRVGSACTFCLRCVAICPAQAMQLALGPRQIERRLTPGFLQALGLDGELCQNELSSESSQ